MTPAVLETTRLQLLPYAPRQVLALLDSVEAFERVMCLRCAEGLRDFMVSDDVSPAYLARLRASDALDVPDPWRHGFAVILRESRSVIGSAGFKGPPDEDGMVEIAYGIVPIHQGQGFATEAATALVAFAVGSGQVRIVRAHTLPTPNASTRVLAKCGFAPTGEVMDPEDGRVWRWERTEQSPAKG